MLCYDHRLELLPSERKLNSSVQMASFSELLDQFILQRDADRFPRIAADWRDKGNRRLIVLRQQPLLTDEKKVSAEWLQSWATEPEWQATRDLKSLSFSNICSFEHQYTVATALGGFTSFILESIYTYGNILPGKGKALSFNIYPPALSCR